MHDGLDLKAKSTIGEDLGPYRILGKCAGGMGQVYRARDTRLKRDVAVKVLPAEDFSDPMARGRLLREAQSAASLTHPHICTVYDVGESCGRVYIAMGLVEGEPLNARLVGGPLPPEQVTRYAIQLAVALAHAHDRGIVHRDLETANVVIIGGRPRQGAGLEARYRQSDVSLRDAGRCFELRLAHGAGDGQALAPTHPPERGRWLMRGPYCRPSEPLTRSRSHRSERLR